MSNIKFDIKDAVSKQNFINLRLAGFSLGDISDALGVSYPTVKRIYDELKPEINSQIAKTKCFDNSALTKKIESFLNALEKHFYIMEEGMIETHNNMNYEQYIASMLKFTNAFEKLVKLRILLNSSQIQQNVSQSNITYPTDPCDPENGSTENTKNDENVMHSSLIAENVPQTLSRELGTSLVAENNSIDSTAINDPCDPVNGSTEINVSQILSRDLGTSLFAENYENVPQPSLVAENNSIDSTAINDPCDTENGSSENAENVPKSLSRELGTSLLAEYDISASTTANDPCEPENRSQNYETESEQEVIDNEIDKDNISFYKYRKLKMKKINCNLQNENNSP